MIYDIFGKVKQAMEKFNTQTITVVNYEQNDNARYLKENDGGYQFSQKRMLQDIDLAVNSVYRKGKYDSQNQRKLYLNIVNFYRNVAKKNTDVDVSNFVFRPVDNSTENIWAVWFLKRQFSNWVKDNGFSKTINDLNDDFNTYGTCVGKRVKDDFVRIPLRYLICDQSAETLLDGVKGGIPLIQEHEFSYLQTQDFNWDVAEEYEGKRKILEVYYYAKPAEIATLQGKPTAYKKDEKAVLTMCILMPEGKMDEDKRKKYAERVLFVEQIDTLPYEECHSEKQVGRWLGRGNVEKQLENQIARNLTVNMRRRSMLWSSKQIFQTQGDAVNKNLVKNVKDGDVMQVGLNGLISKVDLSTRALGDFQADDQVWKENSDQQAFAFESATGESFPSGTPFRLGALLSNSVMGWFDLQKEIFGIFLRDSFFNQILPIYKKRAKDDVILIGQSEEGYNDLKQMFVEFNAHKHYIDLLLSPKMLNSDIPNLDDIKSHVHSRLIKSPYLSVEVPKEIYKNAKYIMDLDITGESDAPADKETLTTLYTSMAQSGDPRAGQVLNVLLASMGKNLAAIAGQAPQAPTQTQQPVSQGGKNPMLQGLLPQNANNA